MNFIKYFLFPLGMMVGASGWYAAAEPPRLNILWITVEDMSAELGCYGDFTVPTPNVDRLAAEGVRYTNAFVPYGVCGPTRSAIITGMYPTSYGAMAMRTWRRTGALDMITDPELLAIPVYEATPPPEVRCFSEFLRAAGYYCTNNEKTDYQFRPPLTAWDESSGTAHWRNRPPGSPFFAVFNIMTTHESRVFEQTSPRVADPDTVPVPPYYPDTPIIRRDIARNYDNIAAHDKEVGAILAELEDDGLLENTIIFYYSDHGSGLPRAKRWVYDSGLHIPLIIRWPGAEGAGTVEDRLVSLVDLAPTMLSLTGLPIPDYMEGRAFLGPQEAPPRKYIYASRDRMDPAPERIRAVRDHRFKYVRNYRPDLPYIGFIPYRDQMELMQEIHRLNGEGRLGPDQWQFTATKKPLEELYDTWTDPHEIYNLASVPANFEKLAELRDAHAAWIEKYGDLGELPETELIKVLWPPDGVQPETAAPEFRQRRLADGRIEVGLHSRTDGASIAWRTEEADRWLLYHEPIIVESGRTVRARAHRIGYLASDERAWRVE